MGNGGNLGQLSVQNVRGRLNPLIGFALGVEGKPKGQKQ